MLYIAQGIPAQELVVFVGLESVSGKLVFLRGFAFVIWFFFAVDFVPRSFGLFSCVVRLANDAASRLISDSLQLRL